MWKVFKDATRGNYGFWICLITSICLLIASFIMPPPGEVAHSVLIGIAELFSFGSLGAVYKAIDKNQSASIKKGDIELTIGDKKDEEAQE